MPSDLNEHSFDTLCTKKPFTEDEVEELSNAMESGTLATTVFSFIKSSLEF